MKIYIAGHRGMAGSALVRAAVAHEGVELVLRPRSDLDLCDQRAVCGFLAEERPDVVINAAARVGGIGANSALPARFLYENLTIAANLVDAAHQAGVGRFLNLSSSCIYPRGASQPLRESALLAGPLEPTNESYSVAKIAGVKLCQYYRAQYGVLFHSAVPANLYGRGDNYHPDHSHVVAALLRRFHEAREKGDSQVLIWGTGSVRREFLHVDDLARSCFHLLRCDNPPDWINVGWGRDVSILELATMIARVVGFSGEIVTDPTKPDGAPRKLLDVTGLKSLGWEPEISLQQGLEDTYRWFLRETETGVLRALN
ncbi:MAG: GDP-L-fucose synthase [Verrucomicrobiota bacterium]|nr:GDP-L-fucose synthase [Verrucomicrobiota bacterium]